MANTSDIRKGLCLDFKHDIYSIIGFQHVKPGKGNAFVRTKLKSLTSGKVIDETFPAGHKITTVRVERRKFQYLYKDDIGFNFMNTENYEQISLEEKFIENANLMTENCEVEVLYNVKTDTPLTIELPQFVELEVTFTEPGLKGNTATNANKPATVSTGAEIRVPLFINQGDFVKIDTETGSYVERVKK